MIYMYIQYDIVIWEWIKDKIVWIIYVNPIRKLNHSNNWVNWIILVTLGKTNQPRFYKVVVSENRVV